MNIIKSSWFFARRSIAYAGNKSLVKKSVFAVLISLSASAINLSFRVILIGLDFSTTVVSFLSAALVFEVWSAAFCFSKRSSLLFWKSSFSDAYFSCNSCHACWEDSFALCPASEKKDFIFPPTSPSAAFALSRFSSNLISSTNFWGINWFITDSDLDNFSLL